MSNPHVLIFFIVKSGRKLLFEIHIGLNTSLICDYCCQDRETVDTRTFGYNLARQLVMPHILRRVTKYGIQNFVKTKARCYMVKKKLLFFSPTIKGTPTKRQVSKRLKRQVYKTSALQNIRFTKCQVYKMSGLQNVRLQKASI